jgi:hypothetical protein
MFSREQLVAALQRDEFFLAYQPQMLPDGQSMAGVEALVRWQHPVRGTIGPMNSSMPSKPMAFPTSSAPGFSGVPAGRHCAGRA